jgi:hypothetical protein
LLPTIEEGVKGKLCGRNFLVRIEKEDWDGREGKSGGGAFRMTGGRDGSRLRCPSEGMIQNF